MAIFTSVFEFKVFCEILPNGFCYTFLVKECLCHGKARKHSLQSKSEMLGKQRSFAWEGVGIQLNKEMPSTFLSVLIFI